MTDTHGAARSPTMPAAVEQTAARGPRAEELSSTSGVSSIPVKIVDHEGRETHAIAQFEALNGGILSRSDGGVMVVTDRRQWAYSAMAVINLPENHGAHTIIINLSVHEGELGAGWISADMSRWVARASAKAGDGVVSLRLNVPQEETEGRLVFENRTPRNKSSSAILKSITVVNHSRADVSAPEAYEMGKAAEREGGFQEAIRFYCEALRQNPKHMLARASLGQLRFRQPPQPFLSEMRKRVQVDTAEVLMEVRNPCNYRCFYCVAAGQNNEPVQRFDLEAIERAYQHITQKCVVTSLECGGGEPTVHPQFPALIELISKFGAVSFPSNNSQNPERWLPRATTRRLLIRCALHPESEERLDRYVRNARYLIEHGCDFRGTFISHPSRLEKVDEYRKYFLKAGVPFIPLPFIGEYQGKPYPYSYSDEEKRMIGIDQPSRAWMQQISPHINRIRNFRSIPCIAGHRSIYITAQGKLRRCIYDSERILERPLSKSEPCGVSDCGCGMLLDKMNTVDTIGFYNGWAEKNDLPELDASWMRPLAEELGYSEPEEAIATEMKAMYDALMAAYGKDEFSED